MSHSSCCLTYSVPSAPGEDGEDGAPGAAGVNAFTTLTALFVMPNPGDSVVIAVADNRWMVPGEYVFIQFAGTLKVTAVNANGTGVTVQNPSDGSTTYMENAAGGTNIPNGSKVVPSGLQGPSGVLASGALLAANNLSDLNNVVTARTNLGLGSLALLSSVNNGNWSGTALAIANGGSGATTAAGARTNFGLGTIATQAANAVALTGGTIVGLTALESSNSVIGNLQISGNFILVPASLSLLAGAVITANTPRIRVQGNAAAITLGTPNIAAPTQDGTSVLFLGIHATNTVTFSREGTLPGSLMRLGAATRVLALYDQLRVTWDATLGYWMEDYFIDNS